MRKRNFHQRYESPEPRTQPVTAEQPEMWGQCYELKTHTDTPQFFTAEQPEVWGPPHYLPGLRKCLYTWIHITYLQTSPPHHFTASDMSCPTTIPLSPPGLKHIRIQTHKHTIQVGWMLNVKAKSANQTDPSKEPWGSLFDLGVSDWKHPQAHTSEAIRSQFAECIKKWEQRWKEERWQQTTTTPFIPFFFNGSFFCLHIWTALILDFLWYPNSHTPYKMTLSRV